MLASRALRSASTGASAAGAVATKSTPTTSLALRRTFQSSARRLDTVVAPAAAPAVPVVRKPVGAFRGGIFGFLLGSTLAGAGVYYYILEEYRVSNELLTEDIYALQAAVQRIEAYTRGLEGQFIEMQKRK